MLRIRRYRAFIIVAIIAVVGLYHLAAQRGWEGVRLTDVEQLKDWTAPLTSASKGKDQASPAKAESKPDDKVKGKVQTSAVEHKEAPPAATSTGEPVPTDKPNVDVGRFGEFAMGGKGRHEAPLPLNDKPPIHWSRMPENFPVPTGSLIALPTGKPQKIPKIQYAFKKETATEKTDRLEKLNDIRGAMNHSWTGYKKHAWMHDELSPVTGDHRDPFCAWAATLVDTLDTLWIMGMKDEFKEAVEAINKLDFTTSPRKDIPVFETTIRYLGGLLAAYDISGQKFPILKTKAVELAEILMGAFDTPNRMPIMYYYWRPTFSKNPHRAGTRVVMAEIGSLSVEFTRLAQITGQSKYYDAIARITNEFEAWQKSTKIPGLWPKTVDASGCKKPETSDPLWFSQNDESLDVPADSDETINGVPVTPKEAPKADGAAQGDAPKPASPNSENQGTSSDKAPLQKRQIEELSERDDSKPMITTTGSVDKVDCEPQGLNSPPGASWEVFSLGGQADSTFEYLPKQHLLLGGQVSQYRSMYEQVADASIEHLIYRPMIPQNDRHILVAGTAEVTDNKAVSKDKRISLRPEITHLTCFVGGMFGIGAKIFEREADLDIAAKLTDGCVWAYEATATGIMPEDAILIPCEDKNAGCKWNETRWHDALDPLRESREVNYRLQKELEANLSAASKKQADSGAAPQSRENQASKSSQQDAQAAAPADNPGSKVAKRQLGSIENEPVDAIKTQPEPPTLDGSPSSTTFNSLVSHEEFVQQRLKESNVPEGMPTISGSSYILRPEAIESVFIMYRITGDEAWRQKGWRMWQAVSKHTKAEHGYSAIGDVTNPESYKLDEMESFWTAETLKYFYLLFSTPETVSLDDYVFNTEAHPFTRPK